MDERARDDRRRQTDEIFVAALERDGTERAAYVAGRCVDNPELQRSVERLLASAEAEEGQPTGRTALDGPLGREWFDDLAWDRGKELRRVGPWQILQRVGRGGMATVYLAERSGEGFTQRAAVKLIAGGAHPEEIAARLEAERRILASLEHPHIARLLDGGTAADGTPYLAMEYVEGEPIDRYCDSRRLSVAGRLELFRAVAGAVQAAHQSLVVHRDLKPSNILVTPEGDVKLLDFGIAKLLVSDDTGQLPATRTGARLMTPEYASPEQVRGEPITTASDVYQLGLLLYELLTGLRAHGGTRGSLSLAEIERAICEEQPRRPSSAVLQGGAAPAEARSTTPERLRRELSGDLDAIVGKALRKEPGRRYSSAAALAEDVGRFLAHRPISARPDGAAYRARKFVRRHRAAVAGAAAAAALTVAWAATATVQARQIARERDRARDEARKAETVRGFLVELFQASTPGESRGETVTARELLDRGAQRLEKDLGGDPGTLAELSAALGHIYRTLGTYDSAGPFLERAVTLRRRIHAGDHADLADSLCELAILEQQRGDLDRARNLALQSLDMRRRVFGEDHEDVAESLDVLGAIARLRDDQAEAERLWQSTLEIRRRRLGPGHPLVAQTLNNLALVRHRAKDLDGAERLYSEALAIERSRLGPTHPMIATTLHNLAVVRHGREDYAGAEKLYREVLGMESRLYGGEHRSMASTLGYLGHLLRDRKDFPGAEAAYRDAIGILRRKLPAGHADTAAAESNLGRFLLDRGRAAEAEPLLRASLPPLQQRHGEAHRRTIEARIALGRSLTQLGRFPAAEAELLAARQAGAGQARFETPALEGLAELYEAWGRSGDATKLRTLIAGKKEKKSD